MVSGLFFFPRGGSAQVAGALGRALPPVGWEVTQVAGSLGRPGDQTHAASFFTGLDIVAVDYSPGKENVPFQPSYEDRPGAPDRVFASIGDESTSGWSRYGSTRSILPARRAPTCCTCTTSPRQTRRHGVPFPCFR